MDSLRGRLRFFALVVLARGWLALSLTVTLYWSNVEDRRRGLFSTQVFAGDFSLVYYMTPPR
jgi:hypothetical protein